MDQRRTERSRRRGIGRKGESRVVCVHFELLSDAFLRDVPYLPFLMSRAWDWMTEDVPLFYGQMRL